ncbi:hypothetical protein Q7P36_005496 [Cladosporium allicinum]
MTPGAHQRANRQPFLDSRSPEQQLANIRVDRRRHHYTTLDLANKREEARELTRATLDTSQAKVDADKASEPKTTSPPQPKTSAGVTDTDTMVAGYSSAYIYLYETYSEVRIWALKPAVRDSMKEIDLRHDMEGKFSMDIGYGTGVTYHNTYIVSGPADSSVNDMPYPHRNPSGLPKTEHIIGIGPCAAIVECPTGKPSLDIMD